MRILTRSKGRAAEYGYISLNLYIGCDHWCHYCYGPDVCHMDRADFRRPGPKPNALQRLEKDARDLAGLEDPIFLSFITDPYLHMDVNTGLTRKAIEILHANNLRVRILTKAGFRSHRDIDLLTPHDYYGATLTFTDSLESKRWEPYAAPPNDRICMLSVAHTEGIPTWVSLEPIMDPGDTLALIRRTHTFVDEFKVGKLNYRPARFDLQDGTRQIVNLLTDLDCSYYIKNDTLPYCPTGTPQTREKKQKVGSSR